MCLGLFYRLWVICSLHEEALAVFWLVSKPNSWLKICFLIEDLRVFLYFKTIFARSRDWILLMTWCHFSDVDLVLPFFNKILWVRKCLEWGYFFELLTCLYWLRALYRYHSQLYVLSLIVEWYRRLCITWIWRNSHACSNNRLQNGFSSIEIHLTAILCIYALNKPSSHHTICDHLTRLLLYLRYRIYCKPTT